MTGRARATAAAEGEWLLGAGISDDFHDGKPVFAFDRPFDAGAIGHHQLESTRQ
jgi:hypothetical protein